MATVKIRKTKFKLDRMIKGGILASSVRFNKSHQVECFVRMSGIVLGAHH